MQTSSSEIWQLLAQVCDPEIPVLSITDLGIVREVVMDDHEAITILITPTYTGCPAMDVIEVNIKATLQEAGFQKIAVKKILSPAWTTDWLTDAGKKKLKAYGIAPPVGQSSDKSILFDEPKAIACPQCNSHKTEMISQFGSTACKALHRCLDCLEPFDYFKCH